MSSRYPTLTVIFHVYVRQPAV